MRTHPVFLRLEGRRCVVVGGDALALAKAEACLLAGAEVVVVASDLATDLAGIRHVARAFRPGDLAGAFLAYASTHDPALIRQLAEDAERHGVLLNVIDMPEVCTFIAPAVLRRGDLQIAIGTGGASPGLAARLRRELETRVGPEYAPFVDILGRVRATLAGDPARAEVVSELLGSPLLELVRQGRCEEIDALLGRVAGNGCTLARLGIALEGKA